MCVNAFGPIQAGDDEKFRQFLVANEVPYRSSLYLNSNGGDVEAAIGIGRLIRDARLSTQIGQYVLNPGPNDQFIVPRKLIPGTCRSAATLIYLGGALRYWTEGAKFGVHQFSSKNPSPEDVGRSQVLSANIATFLSDMGIAPKFLELSSSVASSKIQDIKRKTLEKLGVVTGGETKPVWSLQAADGALYARGEADSLYGYRKVILGHKVGNGFFFHAVIEALGREKELCEHGIVEIVVNGDEYRIDISERCQRKPLNGDVNLNANLTQEEADLLAYSKSFGVQIRASSEADLFLGISALSTEGGKDLLHSIFVTGSAAGVA